MAINDKNTSVPVGNETPELDKWFDKNFYELKPNGNVEYEVAYRAFREVIKGEKDKITGKLLTKEFLVEKYAEYIKYKESLPRYSSGKEKEIMPIYEWLNGKNWTHRYKTKPMANAKRDDYLYGIDY